VRHDGRVHPSVDPGSLPGEWWLVQDERQSADLTRELHREKPPGHVLHGVRAEPVAVKRHLKDVIFWLPDSKQWASVNLTYQDESDPRWPSATLTRRWTELVQELTAD